jgi:hypothetical protein
VWKITLQLVEGAQDFTLHHPETADGPLQLVLVVPVLEADDRLLEPRRHMQEALDPQVS